MTVICDDDYSRFKSLWNIYFQNVGFLLHFILTAFCLFFFLFFGAWGGLFVDASSLPTYVMSLHLFWFHFSISKTFSPMSLGGSLV